MLKPIWAHGIQIPNMEMYQIFPNTYHLRFPVYLSPPHLNQPSSPYHDLRLSIDKKNFKNRTVSTPAENCYKKSTPNQLTARTH